jgi:hypothetical protein
MFRRIPASVAPALLAFVIAAPALAQPSPRDFEIRIATAAPPRPRHERVPHRPDRDSVWVKGYWNWEGSRWDWVNGRWERPERRGVRWIAPRYRREGRAYRYEPPHWSHQRVVEGDEYRRWKEEHRRR